ncbi:ferri-bacillibactin esterase BesA [Aspergillus lentulus]|uniref:Ferri-bacillibactin esterase BesA n=1 Tax=Aspergillus lentulus TaxID=293939 RepID=A0ABQ1AK83_ASPLE|nr:ferri-bacillibactin esterase BesA [Aspergillus lentulus]GFF38568.1 ferri-bacillibactin esterase BesA [Aspergillus lentulus]GFF71769.1 ferri-bacillibactin esterase BesA [Aspergillus lentulus]GFF83443.1 ferri-bacillibactin esterase BesA [Aspergillus lentulus]GFF89123.1 ferri-bacillibactin esterase BesA [Aspergillus lentulus]GFG07511.1 ferri-bacillibactin esterase BesA [Aspergillus lentulus]
MGNRPTPVQLPNSEQFYLESDQGETYLVQVSWPLHWEDKQTGRGALPIIYLVDGNALFLTATEAAWRRAAASHFAGGGIIVAIGYPLNGKLYDARRRSLDLTPLTASKIPGYGGADLFLDFIENSVRPAVKTRFPRVTLAREALYGHSYGGLLALHALFTRPRSFDCYMASSPSIWWNSLCILHEARAFVENEKVSDDKSRSLMVSWGSLEQNPLQWANEPLDHYEARKQTAADLRMAGNALDLCAMLQGCSQLHAVIKTEYEGEDHTSVMSCSLSRSLTMFFEDWPFHQS